MNLVTIKKYLAALAGTLVAVLAAQVSGQLQLPPAVSHVLGIAAGLAGILGARPLGRLIFKGADDAVTTQMVTAARKTGSTVVATSPTGMQKILIPLLLAFALVLGVQACATVQPVLTKVEGTVDCTAKQIASQLPAVLSEVATDLLSQNYAALLTTEAQRVGDALTICAVEASVIGAANRRAATTGAQPNASKIQTNGNAYLVARGIVLSGAPKLAGP